MNDVIRQCGVDSRAARLACVISGASETVFFTASLYLGAADVKRARHAVPAALLAYAAGDVGGGAAGLKQEVKSG